MDSIYTVSVLVKTSDSLSGNMGSIPWGSIGRNSANSWIILLNIANVNAYGCTIAGMWLTQPVARLLRAGFRQLEVVFELDVVS